MDEYLRPQERQKGWPPKDDKHRSYSGFLAPYDTLEEVLIADRIYLASQGVTFDQLADAIEYAAKNVWEDYTDQPVKVTEIGYMGSQWCPFGCDVKTDRDIFIKSTDESFDKRLYRQPGDGQVPETKHEPDSYRVSGLIPHLIREHHFLEGRVQYRADPSILIPLLKIKEIDYSVEKPWGDRIAKETDNMTSEQLLIYAVNLNVLRVAKRMANSGIIGFST